MESGHLAIQCEQKSGYERRGPVQEGTQEALPACLAGVWPEVARGSWSGWSVRLGEGGACFQAVVTMEMAVSAGYVCKEGRGPPPTCLVPGTTWLPVLGLGREMKWGCPAQR